MFFAVICFLYANLFLSFTFATGSTVCTLDYCSLCDLPLNIYAFAFLNWASFVAYKCRYNQDRHQRWWLLRDTSEDFMHRSKSIRWSEWLPVHTLLFDICATRDRHLATYYDGTRRWLLEVILVNEALVLVRNEAICSYPIEIPSSDATRSMK